jgi:hypothetical protein
MIFIKIILSQPLHNPEKAIKKIEVKGNSEYSIFLSEVYKRSVQGENGCYSVRN